MATDAEWVARAERVTGFIAWAADIHGGARYAVRDRAPFPGLGWRLVFLGGHSADLDSTGAFYDDENGTAAEHCAAAARAHRVKFGAALARARPKPLAQ